MSTRRRAFLIVISIIVLVLISITIGFVQYRQSGRLVAVKVNVGANQAQSKSRIEMLPQTLPINAEKIYSETEIESLRQQAKLEVCGKGLMTLNQLEHLWQTDKTSQIALREAASILQSSVNEVDRALGASIAVYSSMWQNCNGAENCPDKANLDKTSARALLAMAQTTNDPVVYAAAVNMCSSRPLSDCESVSPQRWAALDGNNAAAWIAVANDAAVKNDLVARDAAMARAAQQNNYDRRLLPYQRVLQTRSIESLTYTDQVTVGTTLIGLLSSDISNATTAIKYCKPDVIETAGRRESCDAIATLFEKNQKVLIDPMLAQAIGRYAGWPEEKLKPIRDEQKTFTDMIATMADPANPAKAYSCESMMNQIQYVTDVFQIGEIKTLRKKLAAGTAPVSAASDVPMPSK